MENNKIKIRTKALKAAFPHTIPILAGFLFLGFSFGVLMSVNGFNWVYAMLMSITVFGGSIEFVAVSMLVGAYAPIQSLILALIIQARHLFYGISMLKKYSGTGWKKFYLIFGMCDETFAINYSVDAPKDVDKGWFMFFITLLNHIYWIAGSVIGALMGDVLPFNTQGIDFVMTAIFVVIFIDQWMKEKKHYTALIGVVSSAVCLLLFGGDSFMIPTMVCVVLLLTVFRKPIERGVKE